MARRRFGRYTVETSNEDKSLFPEDGITKGDLIEYYTRIASTMLRHLADRPLALERFPDGIAEQGFYQKQVPEHFPDWLETVTVEKQDGEQELVVCDKAAALAYLADQACITLHSWLSRANRPDHPDQMIVDLDPSGDDFESVRRAALWCRELFDELGLAALVKTSGSRGLHVVVPLDRVAEFDTVRRFARDAARLLAHRHPAELTTEVRKSKRAGRLYVDVARNSYAQTAAAPYTVRARAGAPVSAPIEWDELRDPDLGPRTWTVRNVLRRLGQRADPWVSLRRRGRSLDRPRRALDALLAEVPPGS